MLTVSGRVPRTGIDEARQLGGDGVGRPRRVSLDLLEDSNAGPVGVGGEMIQRGPATVGVVGDQHGDKQRGRDGVGGTVGALRRGRLAAQERVSKLKNALRQLAAQGVLFLNAALTVKPFSPGTGKKYWSSSPKLSGT